MALIIDDVSNKPDVELSNKSTDVEEEMTEPIEEIVKIPAEKPFSDFHVVINEGVVLCIYTEPRSDSKIVNSTFGWPKDPPLTIIAEENGFGCIGPNQWIKISDKHVTRV